MSLIAREHDVNANLVFRWRHQYQEGVFGAVSQSATLLPVQVMEAPIDLPHVVQTPILGNITSAGFLPIGVGSVWHRPLYQFGFSANMKTTFSLVAKVPLHIYLRVNRRGS